MSGCRYFLLIVDDYSRRVWVHFLRHKNEAFSKFKEWKQLVENHTGRKLKKLRTDNGLEFGVTDSVLGLPVFRSWAEEATVSAAAYLSIGEAQEAQSYKMHISMGYPDGVEGYRLWREVSGVLVLADLGKEVEFEVNFKAGMVNPTVDPQTMENPWKEDEEPRMKGLNTDLAGQQCSDHWSKEDDMAAYAFAIAEEEDTHEPITFTSEKDGGSCYGGKMILLKKNQTGSSLVIPPGQKLVSCKWLYILKKGLKAFRNQGTKQGWVILSLTACEDYELEQLDVKTTFLHGNLEETIYI
ncbi:retrotransposon protein, putative, ty1-copia subclass, partial [Tanacetum coccineum]